MDSIELFIPDNEGNHLVVALSFYEDTMKTATLEIPEEFADFDLADISINKLYPDIPLSIRAFFKMCEWLIEQFILFPNSIFSFICSTDPLETNHQNLNPQQFRWKLFESFYQRNSERLNDLGIESKKIIIGEDDDQTYARIFYRTRHAPIVHIVIAQLNSKYPG